MSTARAPTASQSSLDKVKIHPSLRQGGQRLTGQFLHEKNPKPLLCFLVRVAQALLMDQAAGL